MAWIQAQNMVVLMCTVPDEKVGENLARALVEESLAACVNIVPGLRSIYRWKGDTCDEKELLLLIKTVEERIPLLARRVKQLHPYETPELVAMPAIGGLDSYLDWVKAQTQNQS